MRITAMAAGAALICLSGCSASAAGPESTGAPSNDPASAYLADSNRGDGPDVQEVSIREGRRLAAGWCAELEARDLASAMRAINDQASRLDAINIARFALKDVCPELEPKTKE